MRKGVLLAGGRGTRLFPITREINKHLIPIFDKPMVYYSLSVLMLSGLREVVVVSSPDHLPAFRALFGDGSALGMSFEYAAQSDVNGIAGGLLAAAEQISGHEIVLVLGDNLLYGQGLTPILLAAAQRDCATIFSYPVKDPRFFGVVEMDGDGNPLSLKEKPTESKSNLAIPGLYFFDADALSIARDLTPSSRGELEIIDICRAYLDRGDLFVQPLGRGMTWMDAGNPKTLLDISNFVASIEQRQGYSIGCIEEIAWRNGWISSEQVRALCDGMPEESYRNYLTDLLVK